MGAVTVIAAARPRRRSQSRVTLRHPLKLLPGIDFSERKPVVTSAEAAGRHARQLIDEEKPFARPAITHRNSLTARSREKPSEVLLGATEPNAKRREVPPKARNVGR
jgi:hypothetical protein